MTQRLSRGWLAGLLIGGVLLVAVLATVVLSDSGPDPLQGWASVKDSGAKGDGSTDDAAAIQKAIDSVPLGGTVVIPPGTYDIGKPLNVTKPTVVYGQGATLKATAPMPYMLRYRSGSRNGVGHGVKGLNLNMNNRLLRNGVKRGFEVRDSWHSVDDIRVFNVRARTGVYVGPLDQKEVVGAYYNEVRVMVSGGGPLYGDPGSIGVQLGGPEHNPSNANVVLGRVENFETGVKVGPHASANVLRELDATGNTVGFDLTNGRTLGYGLWAEVNKEQDVIVRPDVKARLDFQYYQKPARVDGGAELQIYPKQP